jgi:DNA-binding SARP family transcriptional activator
MAWSLHGAHLPERLAAVLRPSAAGRLSLLTLGRRWESMVGGAALAGVVDKGGSMPEAAVRNDAPPASLRVLGRFELQVASRPVPLPSNAQRVLGYLAVTGRTEGRDRLAGNLWGMSTQARANANLRTALWRIRQVHPQIIEGARDLVRLHDRVEVDLQGSAAHARRVLDRTTPSPELLGVPSGLFEADLLPDWDEDWLLLSRERHRQLRIHALEALSEQLTDCGEYARAIDAAYAAIAAEPLRESARTALIRAHLAEGNRAEASRQLELYRDILDSEIGLSPSPRLQTLLEPTAAPAPLA